jgi:hypothetical protein
MAGVQAGNSTENERGFKLRNIMMVTLLVAMAALATGEFSTGGADLLTFKGYVISTFNMYGEELADGEPNNDFDLSATIEWLPTLNDWVDAKIGFKSEPTRYTGTYEDLSLNTEDVIINMHFTEAFTLTMGQFKRPFGYNYTISSSGLYFRDRAMVAEDLIGDFGKRDIGANVNADFGLVNIDLSYTNGEGDNEPEDDDLKSFTARAIINPIEGMNIGAALGTTSEYADSTNQNSYSATGIDIFITSEFPISAATDMLFEGEYLMIGDTMDDAVDYTDASGYAMSVMANFALESEMLQAVRPAIRYETISPGFAGEDDPGNDVSAIDFCLNLDIWSGKNTAQIGMRNYQGEDIDGYTDMYIAWRMKF